MPISEAYQDTLKRRALQRFVKTNKRTPTRVELRDIVAAEFAAYPSVDQVGISGFDIVKPQFTDISSAADENTNRQAAFDDMFTLNNRLNDLVQLLEDSFRGFQSTSKRLNKRLDSVESRLDNLLLQNDQADVFIYGVEETFDSQEKIDFSLTTASVEAGYATLKRGGYNTVDLSQAKLSVSTSSNRGIVATQDSSNLEYLKEEDGTYWEHLVYTNYRQGRVSLMVEIELDEVSFISDIQLTGNPVAVNQRSTVSIFYSLDGQTFTAVEPAEQVFASRENQFNIGIDGIKRLRILISKQVADTMTVSRNQHVYVFSLDSIKLYTNAYTNTGESIIYAGPYAITDEEDNPVRFTKATLNACSLEPTDTSVSWFLSKDNVNFVPVNNTSTSLSVVSFGSAEKSASEDTWEPLQNTNTLLASIDTLDELDYSNEAALNTYLLAASVADVSIRTVLMKRNVVDASSLDNVYQSSPGWYFDAVSNQYTTTVYVLAAEGRYIDFGHSGVSINGVLLSGQVRLQQGYSVITTSDSNWHEVTADLSDLTLLKEADPLYPFNHKYLIEGYSYSGGFSGEQVYAGVDEYFGQLLQYITPEQFNATDFDNDLGVYTIETGSSSNAFFKVKVNKSDASWSLEKFDVDWLVQSDTTNDIYVKAILSTADNTKTPVIDKFEIRVV